MNKESLVVMRFYRLANISRDLFELILNDGKINLDVYNARGNFFKAVIEDPMIVDFFKRAQEGGERMSNQLKDIYTEAYEQKRYLNIKEDEETKETIHVADKSSRVKVLDLAVGTYQSSLDLVKKFAEDAEGKGLLDPAVKDLLVKEENFFTSVAAFGIFKTILDLNNDLQKELQQSQGQPTPIANFTVEELKKLVGMLNFVKNHYTVNMPDITSVFESIVLTLKFLDGTIKVSDFKEITTKVNETVGVAMNALRQYDYTWQTAFKEVIADVNKTQEELKNAKN